MPDSASDLNRRRPGGAFVTTRWSAIRAADLNSSVESQEALSHLCRTYWYPLYAYVRRQGYSSHDAEDLTQTFFANLLEKKALRGVEPAKGKFRSFLLASLKNFLANDWDRKSRAKRGGNCEIISFDDESAEARYLREPSHDLTPETLFERSWSLTVIETVMLQLRREYIAAGKADLFESLQEHLLGGANASYANAAATLGMKEGAVRMATLRMRRHFGYLLRKAIADTVTDPGELDEELRHLMASIGG